MPLLVQKNKILKKKNKISQRKAKSKRKDHQTHLFKDLPSSGYVVHVIWDIPAFWDRFIHGKTDGHFYHMCALGHTEATIRELDILSGANDKPKRDFRDLPQHVDSNKASAAAESFLWNEAQPESSSSTQLSGVKPPTVEKERPNNQRWNPKQSVPTKKRFDDQGWTDQEWKDYEAQKKTKKTRHW